MACAFTILLLVIATTYAELVTPCIPLKHISASIDFLDQLVGDIDELSRGLREAVTNPTTWCRLSASYFKQALIYTDSDKKCIRLKYSDGILGVYSLDLLWFLSPPKYNQCQLQHFADAMKLPMEHGISSNPGFFHVLSRREISIHPNFGSDFQLHAGTDLLRIKQFPRAVITVCTTDRQKLSPEFDNFGRFSVRTLWEAVTVLRICGVVLFNKVLPTVNVLQLANLANPGVEKVKLFHSDSEAFYEKQYTDFEFETRNVGRYDIRVPADASDWYDPVIIANEAIVQLMQFGLGHMKPRIDSYSCIVSVPGAELQVVHVDTPWDNPGHLIAPTASIAMSIPLVNVTADMGSTAFVPGSHLGIRGLNMPKITTCLSIGDVAIYDVRTGHQGLPNVSNSPRPIAFMYYAQPWWHDSINWKIPQTKSFHGMTDKRMAGLLSRLDSRHYVKLLQEKLSLLQSPAEKIKETI